MHIQPGTLIACYKVLGVIGRGSQATVYRAFDVQARRFLALKLLHLESISPGSLAEAQRVGSDVISHLPAHPHIASLYGVGEVERSLYVAMELINGVALHTLLGAPPDATLTVKILAAVASALDAAHLAHVVHGDVKPSNVFLARDGRILVSDFAVAALLPALRPAANAGALGGQTPILAPELLPGASPTPASDRYALAATSFLALTGAWPDRTQLATAVNAPAHQRPRQAYPPALAALPPAAVETLLRGVSSDPRRRFATSFSFVESLAAALRVPMPVSPAEQSGDAGEELLARVSELVEDGQVGSALEALRAASKVMPDDSRLSELQAAIDRECRMAARYEAAVRLARTGEWIAARELLNAIHKEQPNYRDTAVLRRQAFAELQKLWELQASFGSGEPLARSPLRRATGNAGPDDALALHPLIAALRPKGAHRTQARAGAVPRSQERTADSTPARGAGAPVTPAHTASGNGPTSAAQHGRVEARTSSARAANPPSDRTADLPAANLRLGPAGGPPRRAHSGERASAAQPARDLTATRMSNASYRLQALRDGLYLTAWLQDGGDPAATTAQVLAELSQWPLAPLVPAHIERVIRGAPGQPARIGPPAWVTVPTVHGDLGVVISRDEMAAYLLAVGALRSVPVAGEAAAAALAQAGVRHGLLDSELSAFCRASSHTPPRLVARGTPPREGRAEPEYLFAHHGPTVAEVSRGALLARHRWDDVTTGRTVTGRAVAPATHLPRPLRDLVGEGTALEARADVAGGQAVVAVAAGRPSLIGGRITVLPHEYVAETLRGEASFDGSVTLAAVAPGARVRARGDVVVESDTGAVVVEAGGSVQMQGVDGEDRARISAGGDVVARWLRGGLLMSGDTVRVGTELVQAKVLASRRVETEERGLISGGLVRATEEVTAGRIHVGDGATPMQIRLGRLAGGRSEESQARLRVHGEIGAGVRVTIDGAALEVQETIIRSVLRRRGREICIEPFAA